MSIFGDIFDSIKGVGSSVFDTVKGFGGQVFDTIKGGATKLYDGVLKPVGNKIWNTAQKAEETGERVVERIADKADRLTDKGIDAVGNVGNLLGNPVFMIGVVIVGGIVASKLIK